PRRRRGERRYRLGGASRRRRGGRRYRLGGAPRRRRGGRRYRLGGAPRRRLGGPDDVGLGAADDGEELLLLDRGDLELVQRLLEQTAQLRPLRFGDREVLVRGGH